MHATGRRPHGVLATAAEPLPLWLARELRSDHAGELGAVWIYRAILALSRDRAIRAFAWRHLLAESRHLRAMERLVAPSRRSRLIALWRVAGWVTGAIAALGGRRGVARTIDAVEQFVDHHYSAQIARLRDEAPGDPLRAILETFRGHEIHHRDEARALIATPPGVAARAWGRMVGTGSALAVRVARRF